MPDPAGFIYKEFGPLFGPFFGVFWTLLEGPWTPLGGLCIGGVIDYALMHMMPNGYLIWGVSKMDPKVVILGPIWTNLETPPR